MMKRTKKKRNSGIALPPSPKFLGEEIDHESVKERSMANEARLSEMLGFTLTPGSGCSRWAGKKSDGYTDEFRIECKETKSSSIRITSEMLKKIYTEAKFTGREPVMVVSIYGVEEPTPCDWLLIPAYLFEE